MISGGLRNSASYSKRPKLSIITVVLNGEEFIYRYLQNVLGFLNPDVELVMIDGGSTDATLEVLNQNNQLIDYWLSEPDDGIYDAMNKAVKYARGQWFCFIGIDDMLLPGFNDLLPMLKQQKTIYYGNVISYGKLMTKVYDAYFLTKLNICHQGIFYPKAVFEKYSYNTRYQVYADYHLNLQCWQDTEFKFTHCNLLVASFQDGGFSTHTQDINFEQDRDVLFKQYLGLKAYYRYINRTRGMLQMFKHLIAG